MSGFLYIVFVSSNSPADRGNPDSNACYFCFGRCILFEVGENPDHRPCFSLGNPGCDMIQTRVISLHHTMAAIHGPILTYRKFDRKKIDRVCRETSSNFYAMGKNTRIGSVLFFSYNKMLYNLIWPCTTILYIQRLPQRSSDTAVHGPWASTMIPCRTPLRS
jgi:hypothetical protein